MLNIKEECTGCMACVNKCPVSAIDIQKNEYGFVFPMINADKCINCNMCNQVCPIDDLEEHVPLEKRVPKKINTLEAFSMFHNSEDVVEKSSSGGVFYGLAQNILKKNGIVFGCYYNIEQKRAYLTDTDHVSLDALLQSKYVESYIGADSFKHIEDELKKGREVLFCGTPCQNAGLKSYLGKDYENILMVDFACGGVSAQPYLVDYLNKLESEYDSKICNISFREKYYGWGQNCLTLIFENGQIYRKTAMADPFYYCFLRSSMQRLSCHGCHFSDDHKSDISIADFWRCDHFDVNRNDRKGISLVLAFSEKGSRRIEELNASMHIEALPTHEASYNLQARYCPESKLEEIYRDMTIAYREGVTALRNRLLSEEEIEFYEKRQQIMDDEKESALHPDIVGRGQIQ